MGNALVDKMTILSNDNILSEIGLPKASMQLVDAEQSAKIQELTANFENSLVTGGSAANTIRSLAHLGVESAYIGKVGNDELGKFFRNQMRELNIFDNIYSSETPTGLAVALVSPDSERTFATYLGAASELKPEEINKEVFQKYDYIHIEGYLVFNHDLIRKAFEIAHECGLKIAIDMASYNIVDLNREFLLEMIKKYVHVVFANEEEARSLTGKLPEDAVHDIAEICDIAVVKIGSEGSIIKQNNELVRVGVRKTTPVDTTGAGDNYAAGFLYGLANNWSLKQSAQLGTIMASKVIEVTGTSMDEEAWNYIMQQKDLIEQGKLEL